MSIESVEMLQNAVLRNNFAQAYLDYGVYAGKDSFVLLEERAECKEHRLVAYPRGRHFI